MVLAQLFVDRDSYPTHVKVVIFSSINVWSLC